MKGQARLILTALTGLGGIIGLALLLSYYLPGEAAEYLRREAQRKLDGASTTFASEMMEDFNKSDQILSRIAADLEVIDLVKSKPDDLEAMSGKVGLAKELCLKYGLEDLVVIDSSGVLRSLHPEAAKIGMSDPNRLAMAKQAKDKALFVTPFERTAELGDHEESKCLAAIAQSFSVANGKLWLLTATPITSMDIKAFVRRMGVEFIKAVTSKDKEQAESSLNHRNIPIIGMNGKRIMTITIGIEDRHGDLISKLLLRKIAILAIPWTLMFVFLLLLLGWPKPKLHKDD